MTVDRGREPRRNCENSGELIVEFYAERYRPATSKRELQWLTGRVKKWAADHLLFGDEARAHMAAKSEVSSQRRTPTQLSSLVAVLYRADICIHVQTVDLEHGEVTIPLDVLRAGFIATKWTPPLPPRNLCGFFAKAIESAAAKSDSIICQNEPLNGNVCCCWKPRSPFARQAPIPQLDCPKKVRRILPKATEMAPQGGQTSQPTVASQACEKDLDSSRLARDNPQMTKHKSNKSTSASKTIFKSQRMVVTMRITLPDGVKAGWPLRVNVPTGGKCAGLSWGTSLSDQDKPSSTVQRTITVPAGCSVGDQLRISVKVNARGGVHITDIVKEDT